MASIQQLIVDQKKELIFSNKEPVFETFEGETHSFVIDSSEPHRQMIVRYQTHHDVSSWERYQEVVFNPPRTFDLSTAELEFELGSFSFRQGSSRFEIYCLSFITKTREDAIGRVLDSHLYKFLYA